VVDRRQRHTDQRLASVPLCLLLKGGGEAVGADVVVAVEHSEAAEGGGNADCGEAGMASGRIGAAVVHGGAYGNAGWHFVV